MSPTGHVSAASAQGLRSYQEDRRVCHQTEIPGVREGSGDLLAVFDGHRGAAAAEKAARALGPLFESALLAHPGDVPEALRELFKSLWDLTRDDQAGCTASVAYIPESAQSAYIAVLGDSPVAVLDGSGQLHIGPEHNVRSNVAERQAAIARGGCYVEGYLEDAERPGTGLQMARTLGDSDLARVLSREPEIETVPLGGSGLVLVASDGILSPMGGSLQAQLGRLMEMLREGAGPASPNPPGLPRPDAQAIVDDALHRRTGDNVTAIVWKRL